MSLPMSFDRPNALHVLKVAGYTVASAGVALLANLIPFIHTDNQIILLLEAIFTNTIAVALEQYFGEQASKEQAEISNPQPPQTN